jgi:hypothetical protein
VVVQPRVAEEGFPVVVAQLPAAVDGSPVAAVQPRVAEEGFPAVVVQLRAAVDGSPVAAARSLDRANSAHERRLAGDHSAGSVRSPSEGSTAATKRQGSFPLPAGCRLRCGRERDFPRADSDSIDSGSIYSRLMERPMGCRVHSLAENYFLVAPRGPGPATRLDCWLHPRCGSGLPDGQQPVSAISPVDGMHRPLPEPVRRHG